MTSDPHSDLVTFEITADGKAIPDIYGISRIETFAAAHGHATALITIADGSAIDEEFQATDSKTFAPGTELQVKLGYHAKNKTVFAGHITKLSVEIPPTSQSQLIVEATAPEISAPGTLGAAVATLEYGNNILEFHGTLDASGQIDGTVTTPGSDLLQVCKTIALSGVSRRLSGDQLIRTARHVVTDGEWYSTLEFGP